MGLSTHILDTAKGRPAVGVSISLAISVDGSWRMLHEGITDTDGRIKHLLPAEQALCEGLYRVRFDTKAYFAAEDVTGLYPFVDVVVNVGPGKTGEHFHIPLLLTPNGYTTYRGS